MQYKKAEIWNRAERIKITQWVILANEPGCAKDIFRFNQKSLNDFKYNLPKMLLSCLICFQNQQKVHLQ
jgi:hypothetical protein